MSQHIKDINELLIKVEIILTVLLMLTYTCTAELPTPDETVFVLKGADQALIPCRNLPDDFKQVTWSQYKAEYGLFEKMLKYNYKNTTAKPRYYKEYNAPKYQMTASVRSTLVVTDIDMEDTRWFQCEGAVGTGSFTLVVKLQVVVPPSEDSLSLIRRDSKDIKGPYVEATSYELYCRIINLLPGKESLTFRYVVDGEVKATSSKNKLLEGLPNSEGTVLVDYRVNMTFSKGNNGKTMKCVAEWKAGENEKNVTTTVQNITVAYKPESVSLTASPGIKVNAGDDVTFMCNVTSSPKPRLGLYRWALSEALDTEIDLTLTKKLTTTKSDNGAQFYCRADDNDSDIEGWDFNVWSQNVTLNVRYKPITVSITPSATTVNSGSTVSITCSIDSNPEPRLRMYRVGAKDNLIDKVPKNTSLNWSGTMTKEDNGAQFYCRADDNKRNIDGWDFDLQSEKVTVTVRYKPESVSLTVSPRIQVNAGTEVAFSCSVDSNPAPRLRLYRRGSPTPLSTETALSLTKTHATNKSDNGAQFYCKAEGTKDINGWDFVKDSRNVTLNIQFNATQVEMTVSPTGLKDEDENVKYECVSDTGNPTPEIRWTRDGEEIKDSDDGVTVSEKEEDGDHGGKKRNSTLTMKVSRQMNGKRLKCHLDGQPNKAATDTLRVAFEPDGVHLDVGDPVKTGRKKTVKCRSNSVNPRSNLTMKITVLNNMYDGQYKSESDGLNEGKTVTFTYTFTVNKTFHGKQVSCVPVWRGKDLGGLVKTESLDIWYPPTVDLLGTNNPVEESAKRDLICDTTEAGNPEEGLTYRWLFKKKYEEGPGPAFQFSGAPGEAVDGGTKLHLENLKYSEMGGTYKCEVTNQGGTSVSTEKELIVHYSAKCLNSSDTNIVYAALHSEANLSLAFSINPTDRKEMIWVKNETKELPRNCQMVEPWGVEKFIAVYTIQNVEADDYDKYKVQIKNNAIKKESSCQLTLMNLGSLYTPIRHVLVYRDNSNEE